MSEGPDPSMSLVVELGQNTDDLSLRNGAERCVRLYVEDAETIEPGEIIPKGKHVNLNLESYGLHLIQKLRKIKYQHIAEES